MRNCLYRGPRRKCLMDLGRGHCVFSTASHCQLLAQCVGPDGVHTLGPVSVHSLGPDGVHTLGLHDVHTLGLHDVHTLGLHDVHSLGPDGVHTLGLHDVHTLGLHGVHTLGPHSPHPGVTQCPHPGARRCPHPGATRSIRKENSLTIQNVHFKLKEECVLKLGGGGGARSWAGKAETGVRDWRQSVELCCKAPFCPPPHCSEAEHEVRSVTSSQPHSPPPPPPQWSREWSEISDVVTATVPTHDSEAECEARSARSSQPL